MPPDEFITFVGIVRVTIHWPSTVQRDKTLLTNPLSMSNIYFHTLGHRQPTAKNEVAAAIRVLRLYVFPPCCDGQLFAPHNVAKIPIVLSLLSITPTSFPGSCVATLEPDFSHATASKSHVTQSLPSRDHSSVKR